MRGFTLVELLVVILIIMMLIGIVLFNIDTVRENTDDIQFGSQLNQAKLELLSQHLNNYGKRQFTYTDEKGYLWMYNTRDKLIIGISPSGQKVHTGNIYGD